MYKNLQQEKHMEEKYKFSIPNLFERHSKNNFILLLLN